MHDRRWILIGGACLALAGCDDDTDGTSTADAGQPDAGTESALTATTYNLGLLSSVGYATQRAPLAIQATAALDTDVQCVQEVWEKAHWDMLVDASRAKRPHTLRLPDAPGATGMCSPDEFNPLETCAAAACANAPSLIPCTLANCAQWVAALGASCIPCLTTSADAGQSLAQIRASCVGAGTATGSTPETRAYLSGGSYGIGLLSAKPFAATETKSLDSSTVRRGILYGRLDDTQLGTVHVFCTHLSAILTGIKYEGSYTDWPGENAAHVQALIDYVREKAGSDGKVLVLGDLNTGPAGAGIEPSVPASYAKLPAAGFADPFLTGPNAACTYCRDNPLVAGDDSAANATIDHILVRGISQSTDVTRVLDQPVEIDVPSAQDAGTTTEKRTLRLSDHYGLHARVAR